MVTTLAPVPVFRAFDAAGAPLAFGKLYSYAAGTSTPLVTYKDSTGSSQNTNPVILDANGQCALWLGASSYKLELHDAADVLQAGWPVDQIDASSLAGKVNLTDLADTTNVALGDALVGVKRVATGSVARKLHDYIEGQVLNAVTDFGAVGDGTTNDTAALQAAVTAAAGRTLYIPKGIYKIMSPLDVQSYTQINGDSTDTVIKLGADIYGYNCTSVTDVRISRLKILGTVIGTLVKSGVLLDTSTECTIDSVTVEALSWSGIYVNNSSSNTITNCRFKGFLSTLAGGADINIYRDSNWNHVEGNYCYGGGEIGIQVQAPASETPIGNTIIGNHIGAHTAYGINVYTHVIYDTKTVVDGNDIQDISGSAGTGVFGGGIYIQSAAGTIVTNNKISNCCTATTNFTTLAPAGIGVSNILTNAPVVISNNVITGMTKAPGIHVQLCPVGVVVTGNSIKITNSGAGTKGYGIWINSCSNAQVSGNFVNQGRADYSGIEVFGSVDPFTNIGVTGNTVISVGQGITFEVSGGSTITGVSVSGNTVNATLQGIYLQGCNSTSVVGNTVKSGTSPLYVSGCLYTNVVASSFITSVPATYGLVFTGTNTGSTVAESCYFNGVATSDAGNGTIITQYASSTPGWSGTHAVGDRIIQSVPVAGNPKGWRATVAGNPGTWVSEGNL